MVRSHRGFSLSSMRGHGATDRDHHKHLSKLREKGPLKWHTSDPNRGSRKMAIKNDFIAMLGEYVGTVLFMIFALGGTNVALIPTNSITGDTASGEEGSTVATVDTSNLLYISLCFGFSLAVNAWIFFRVSGGLFNPAVSLGMALVGALTPKRAALLSVSQVLGGITGAAIIQAITPGTLNCLTTLGGGTSIVQGLFIEMFLTSLLMLAILLLAAEKHKATFIAPIGIGLALFVAELLGVYYTGGSLNPARSFGPAVVIQQFDGYHWIYWLGPALGATIAAGFYKLLKVLQYETVLGLEDGEEATPASQGDEENNITGAGNGGQKKNQGVDGGKPEMENEKLGNGVDRGRQGSAGNWKVSGPGLGDLHTVGEYNDNFELELGPRAMGARLDHIEHLLERLAQNQSPRNRHSDLTVVDSDSFDRHHQNKSTSRFSEDLRLNPASEERIRASVGGNRLEPLPARHTDPKPAGKPRAELGPPK